MYSMKETQDVACVEVEPEAGNQSDDAGEPASRKQRTMAGAGNQTDNRKQKLAQHKKAGKKRRHEDGDEETVEPKLTSKQVSLVDQKVSSIGKVQDVPRYTKFLRLFQAGNLSYPNSTCNTLE